MKHTHTPGPWRVENWKYTLSRSAWRREGVPTIIGGSDAIGELFNLWGEDREAERLANARLITAAPDLMAALIQTVDALEFWFPRWGDPGGTASEMMNQARAAIAKAKGNLIVEVEN